MFLLVVVPGQTPHVRDVLLAVVVLGQHPPLGRQTQVRHVSAVSTLSLVAVGAVLGDGAVVAVADVGEVVEVVQGALGAVAGEKIMWGVTHCDVTRLCYFFVWWQAKIYTHGPL